jgi:hypothetical protein
MRAMVKELFGVKMNDIEQMIRDCINREHKLNEWEVKFINSLADKGTVNLNAIQYAKLSEIWDRIT